MSVALDDQSIRIYNLENNKIMKQFNQHQDYISQIIWFNKSDSLITSSIDRSIIINRGVLTDYNQLTELNSHQHWIQAIDIDSSDQFLLSGDIQSNIYLWDLQKQSSMYKLRMNSNNELFVDSIKSLQFNPDNQQLFMSATKSAKIQINDTRVKNQSQICFDIENNCILNNCELQKNGFYLQANLRNSRIMFYDIRNQKCIKQFDQHVNNTVNINSQFYGEDKLIVGSENHYIYLYDLNKGLVNQIYTGNTFNVINRVKDKKIVNYSIYNQKLQIFEPSIQNVSQDKLSSNQMQCNQECEENVQYQLFMQQFNQQIIHILNKNNLSYQNFQSIKSLYLTLQDLNDQSSIDLLSQLQSQAIDILSQIKKNQPLKNEIDQKSELMHKNQKMKSQKCQKCQLLKQKDNDFQ